MAEAAAEGAAYGGCSPGGVAAAADRHCILVLVALPLVLLPLYTLVNPPVTTVMLLKALGGNGIDKTWTDIDHISPQLVRAVLTSEDQRFCFHHGIDWVEVQNALDDEDGRFRGASTDHHADDEEPLPVDGAQLDPQGAGGAAGAL